MSPRPTNPSASSAFSAAMELLGLDHLAGMAECLDACGRAAVDRHLHQGLADLVQRAAIGQRAFEMKLELVPLPGRGQDAQIVHAALPVGEVRLSPDLAPAPGR